MEITKETAKKVKGFDLEFRANFRLNQLRFPDITDFEKCLILEKIRIVREIEMENLKNRPEDQIMVEWTTKKGNITELHQVPQSPWVNSELPETEAFVEQGLIHKNDRLTPMEKSLLREGRRYGNKILSFHKKNSNDLQKRKHLKESTIKEWLGCDDLDANTLSESWRLLGLNKQTIHKLIFGYNAMPVEEYVSELKWLNRHPLTKRVFKLYNTRTTMAMQNKPNIIFEEKSGMKKAKKVMAEYFEKLAKELPKLKMPPEPKPENHELLEHVDSDIGRQIAKYSEQGLIKIKANDLLYSEEEYDEFGMLIKEEDPAESPFGMHPLYYGAEGCDHKFLTRINTANHTELKKIMQLLLPRTITRWDGYKHTERPKMHYLTSMQKSQAWRYIKDREVKLAKMYEKEAPEEIKIACQDMREEYYRNAWKIFNEQKLGKNNRSKYEWLLTFIRYKEKHSTNQI